MVGEKEKEEEEKSETGLHFGRIFRTIGRGLDEIKAPDEKSFVGLHGGLLVSSPSFTLFA